MGASEVFKNENLKSQLFSLWQYPLWSFQTRGIKLERFLPKNQHTQRKFINFENWCNRELSKVGHPVSNNMI